jgi:hypothetical protein
MNILKENSMLKKSLFIGSITLALLVLFALTGCSSPTGADGASGPRGTETYTGAITAVRLANLFEQHDEVQVGVLDGATTTITGIVPPGKTLNIAGVVSTAAGGLTINGTAYIFPGATLNASTATALIDRGSSGRLRIGGTIIPDATFFDAGIPSWVSFEGPEAEVFEAAATAAKVNAFFGVGIPAVRSNDVNLLLPLNLYNTLSKWETGKKLVVGAITAFNNIDVSGKGDLVVATSLALGANTLKASDTGNVTIAGTLNMNSAAGVLEGKIAITGVLSVAETITAVIPDTVDLSKASIVGAHASAAVVLPLSPSPGKIGDLNPGANGLTISITDTAVQDLTVGTITGAAGPLLLTLTAGSTVTVEDGILAGTAADIQSSAALTLKPTFVSGAGGLQPGATVVLDGPITIASGSTINPLLLANLGQAAPYTQLGQITGGSVAMSEALAFNGTPAKFNTGIVTTAAVNISGNVTFDAGLAVTGADVTISAQTPVTVAFNDTSVIGANFAAGQQSVTISGAGSLTIAGALTGSDITVAIPADSNGDPQFIIDDTAGTAVIQTLTVGSKSGVGAGVLAFGPGKYAATGSGFTVTASSGELAPSGAANLVLGEGDADSNLTLVGADATSTFTGDTGVILSGANNGSIVISAGGDLELGNTAVIKLGDGVIALENAGTLTVGDVNTSKITGFTYAPHGAPSGADETLVLDTATPSDTQNSNAVYSSGIGITANNGAYIIPVDTVIGEVVGGTSGPVFTGSASNGGIIWKGSDVAL